MRHPRFADQYGKANHVMDFVPYSSHIADDAVLLRDGCLMRIFRLEGLSFETVDPEDVVLRAKQLNTLWRAIGSSHVAIWTHIVRRKTTDRLHGEFEGIFLQELDAKYYDSFRDYAMMKSELYVTIIYRPRSGKVAGMMKKAQKRTAAEIREDVMANLRKLDDITSQAKAMLARYGCEVLGCYDMEVPEVGEAGRMRTVRYSEILEFLNFLLTGKQQPVRVPGIPLYEYLGDAWLYMGSEVMEIRSPDSSRYAKMIDFKDYVSFTEPGMLNQLLIVDYEFVLTQSFSFMDKHDGKFFFGDYAETVA